jgi:hypothetical protein
MESTNSGQQWHPYTTDFNSDTARTRPVIAFADSQVGYEEGEGVFKRTVDGGSQWVTIGPPKRTAKFPFPTTHPSIPPQAAKWPSFSSTEFGYSLRYSPRWFDGGSVETEHYFTSQKDNGSPLAMGRDDVMVGVSADCQYVVGGGTVISQSNIAVDTVPAVRYFLRVSGYDGIFFDAAVTVEPGGLCYRITMFAWSQKAIESNLADFDMMLQTVRFSERTTPETARPRPTPPPTS